MNEFAHKFCTHIITGLFAEKLEKFSDTTIFEKIERGSILPDTDENFQAYAGHFFNPVTNTNYLGSENHAKSRCLAHLANFILNHGWTELGRSLHFLEDVCTPVHVQYEDSSDAIFKLPFHVEFENEFDNFLENTTYDFEMPKKSGNIEFLLNHAALKSAELYHDYKNSHSQKQQKNEIFTKMLKNTVVFGCALVRFALDNEHFAQEIFCNMKYVGYVIDNKIFAATTDNFRFRIVSSKKFAIFYKPSVGRNFVFSEKREFVGH